MYGADGSQIYVSNNGANWTAISSEFFIPAHNVAAYGSTSIAVSLRLFAPMPNSENMNLMTFGDISHITLGGWKTSHGLVDCTKVSGNRHGSLWAICNDSIAYVGEGEMNINGFDPFFPKRINQVAVRDRVYVEFIKVERNGSTQQLICSRHLNPNVLDHICTKHNLGIFINIAVSDTTLFAMADNGTLYSTPLPLTTSPKFINTGFQSPGARSIIIPIDESYPVVLSNKYSIQILSLRLDHKRIFLINVRCHLFPHVIAHVNGIFLTISKHSLEVDYATRR
ncbi:hypothetical protein HDU97_004719 [Phlyctochytrium planicorne]|nr:hypothetical protein HDU97_004719 [Phlyctochytrium planicorne]